jgi:cell division protein FtsQ
MDGGRRLLRPVREVFAEFQPSLPAYAGVSNIVASNGQRHAALRARRPSARRDGATWFGRLLIRLTTKGSGSLAALLLMACVGLYGAILGGEYATFTASEGDLPNFLARAAGLGIKSVTVTGARDLSDEQILSVGGIGHRNSLPFLDVAKVRDKLKALPLVKNASVSKLYPNRLVIEIEERQPFALWQKDGDVEIVAADGTPIDALRDAHFVNLPLVVGAGANARIGEYVALLNASGNLRPRIAAGILVAQRRWTLKMSNGVEVALPERGAVAAVSELADLQQDHGVLDKDVLTLDMRIPGRLIVRLPEDTAQARADSLAPHKAKPKASQT